MTGQTVEQAIAAFAEAAVNGDMAATLRMTTPEGLAKMADATGSTWFKYLSYEALPPSPDGAGYLVEISYETDIGPRKLRYRFRDIESEWMVVDAERLD